MSTSFPFIFNPVEIINSSNFYSHLSIMLDNIDYSEESGKGWVRCPEKENSKKSHHVIRKFINSAIYVEKPLTDTSSSENMSISQKCSSEDIAESSKTKRCTCSVDHKTCPCHGSVLLMYVPKESKTSTPSAIIKTVEVKTKLSHTSSLSSNNSEKEDSIKNWIAKKEEEKKKKELKEKMKQEAKMKEREILLEQERNNFKMWLMNKKKIEMDAKKKKQKELEEKQLKELEKEKRQLENQLNFQLWLKKKEEAHLERKIKQQMEVINELERKEKQLRDNEKAFNEWLRNSKNRPKPLPLNKGLQSLCSSNSITYINPNPWNPVD